MGKAYEIRVRVTGEGAPQVQMIKRDLEAMKRSAAGVDSKFAATNVQARALGRNMNTARASAVGLGSDLKRAMGYFGIAAGGYMLISQLKDASRAAMQLESDLANVNSLLGKSHPMYNQYREDVMALKKEVPVLEMRDLTKGLYDTISAGIEAEGAMDATTAMAYAAAGGWSDLGTVVRGTTTLMNAYCIAGKDATRATDVGLKTVEKGKLTYGEYAEGISMVAGSAATAEVSIEDLHAAISIASRVQRPEQTFTGLNMAISSLYQRKAELAKMGIEVTTFSDTMRQIHEMAPTPEQWNRIMPEMRAARTLQAINLQYDDFVEVLKEFDNVSGTTMEKFGERVDTNEYKMAKFGARVEEMKIGIGEGLNIRLGKTCMLLDDLGTSMDEFSPSLGKMIKDFSIWDATILGLLGRLYDVKKEISERKARGETRGLYMTERGRVLTPEEVHSRVLRENAATEGASTAAWSVAKGWGAGGATTRAPVPAMPPEEAAPATAPGGGEGRSRGGGGGGIGTRMRGGNVLYQTIEKVIINAKSVDEKSFMKLMGKIVESEAPA